MLILFLKERCRIFYKNLRCPFNQNYIFSHPVLFGVFSIILTTLVILVTVVLMIYLGVYLGFVQGESGLIFRFNHFTVHLILELKVLALNCWGMPGSIKLSEDKELRIKHIGNMIAKVSKESALRQFKNVSMIVQAEHDVYLLSELWMRPDHETIMSRLPPGDIQLELG